VKRTHAALRTVRARPPRTTAPGYDQHSSSSSSSFCSCLGLSYRHSPGLLVQCARRPSGAPSAASRLAYCCARACSRASAQAVATRGSHRAGTSPVADGSPVVATVGHAQSLPQPLLRPLRPPPLHQACGASSWQPQPHRLPMEAPHWKQPRRPTSQQHAASRGQCHACHIAGASRVLATQLLRSGFAAVTVAAAAAGPLPGSARLPPAACCLPPSRTATHGPRRRPMEGMKPNTEYT
jgi:hypothetical protein